jgi:hypothetical protein
LRSFIFAAVVEPPHITKTFELVLPLGKGISKRISYRNPYPGPRVYSLLCSRRDLLTFKEEDLSIPGGETSFIGMRFAPCGVPGIHDILVVINDATGKTEECFSVKVVVKAESV